MEDWMLFAILAILLAAGICYNLVKKSNNRKAAQSGEDLALLRSAAAPLMTAAGSQQVLYAHWEKHETYGRTTKTTYYRYAVTFQGEKLYVAPLHVDKKTRQFQVGQPAVFSPENLGKVTVNSIQKDGATVHTGIVLNDKQGETLFRLDVDAENLRSSQWYPVNIEQQEACAEFERFMNDLVKRVAAENPGVDELIKANDNAGLGGIGAGVAILGAVFAFFLPPAGIGLTLIGLFMAIMSRAKGARSKVPLIICIVCTLWSAVFLAMYLFL